MRLYRFTCATVLLLYGRPLRTLAAYDPATDTWSRAFQPLPSPVHMVHAQLVTRRGQQAGGEARTTLLVVGGEAAAMEDGIAVAQVGSGARAASWREHDAEEMAQPGAYATRRHIAGRRDYRTGVPCKARLHRPKLRTCAFLASAQREYNVPQVRSPVLPFPACRSWNTTSSPTCGTATRPCRGPCSAARTASWRPAAPLWWCQAAAGSAWPRTTTRC